MDKKGKLILEDGTELEGNVFGFPKSTAGEVVFNTSMVGYPESLTDPSYRGQILTLTYPLIGNYGVPGNEKEHGLMKYFESDRIQVNGLLISDLSEQYHHWAAKKSLDSWMKEYEIPGIYGIDTRMLTKKLREKGVMLGKLVIDKDLDFEDPNKRNLVSEVSIKEKTIYNDKGKKTMILIDCGTKNNIIRSLIRRNMRVIRVPWDYNFLKESFEGIVISNGPGNPKMCDKTIENVKKAMDKEIPIFGICLGNQILALAAGGDTYKLKYGHRSQNQPCIEKGKTRCYITSQNHGYAVDMKSLSNDWEEWFFNANDNTNEGIKHKSKHFMSVQFHPEVTPGPGDSEYLFDEFLKLIIK